MNDAKTALGEKIIALKKARNAVVLAHYFADAFLYRFRIPEIRKVMLARMGMA